jgi:hypothetical protein
MRYLFAVVAALGLINLSNAATKAFIPDLPQGRKPTAHVERGRLSLVAPRYMSLNADNAKGLKRVIVRNAVQERWWMLFVGTTLIAYRLFRKHQVLFEGSFLSLAHDIPRGSVTSTVLHSISVPVKTALEA